MSGFFKKLLVFTIGLSSVAMADYMDPACCPQPPCQPCGNWCDNFCFYGSWLYWKVNCDDIDYAVVKTQATNTTDRVEKENFHNVKGDWDSGFRIGVAFDVPDCCWGIDLNWTHFNSSSSNTENVFASSTALTAIGLPSVAFSDFILDEGSDESAKVRGTLHFRYNTADLEFGRWFNCGLSCLLFRPHIGFRYADINETFKNSIDLFGITSPNVTTSAEFHGKNRFHGLGVRVGFDADLRLCDGFSLVGRTAISLISGRTHIKQTYDFAPDHIGSSPGRNVNFSSELKDHYRHKRAIADLCFGIRYKTLVCECYPAFIELAWEHHYLWEQHRFIIPDNWNFAEADSGFRKSSNLAVQGLTLTLGLCF